MSDTVTWTQHADDVWRGRSADHEYLAIDLGPASTTPNFSWFLRRDDCRKDMGTRITNLGRVMAAAEMWEQGYDMLLPLSDPRNRAVLNRLTAEAEQ